MTTFSLLLAMPALTTSWHRESLQASHEKSLMLLAPALLKLVSSAMDSSLASAPRDFSIKIPGPAGLRSPTGGGRKCLIPGGGNPMSSPLRLLSLSLPAKPLLNERGASAAAVAKRLSFFHLHVGLSVCRHDFDIANDS